MMTAHWPYLDSLVIRRRNDELISKILIIIGWKKTSG